MEEALKILNLLLLLSSLPSLPLPVEWYVEKMYFSREAPTGKICEGGLDLEGFFREFQGHFIDGTGMPTLNIDMME